MAREREGFRENLERLDKLAPGKEMLCVSDIQRVLGIHRSSVERLVRGHKNVCGLVSKVTLARLLST